LCYNIRGKPRCADLLGGCAACEQCSPAVFTASQKCPCKKAFLLHGIISAESPLRGSFGRLRRLRAMLARGIYGFAKMPLQASIFASWYNLCGKPRFADLLGGCAACEQCSPAVFAASRKCPCKHTFSLHGIISAESPAARIFWAAMPPANNARPRYLRLRENALASKHFCFMV